MPDVCYVCLSDLHLGADNSLLTALDPDGTTAPLATPPVLSRLGACLRWLVSQNESPKPAGLVLNGDVLELALTTPNFATMAFDRFVEQFFPPDDAGRFDHRLLFVPGNHDHAQWQEARENELIRNIHRLPVGVRIPTAGYVTTTPWRDAALEARTATAMLRRHAHLSDAVGEIVYPNFGLRTEDGRRCVVFHHGHYVESICRLMTTLCDMIFVGREGVRLVADIEAENWAWIDFFWSTMGRSGDAGRGVGIVYKMLQDAGATDALLERLAGSLAAAWSGGLVQRVEAKALHWLLEKAVGSATENVLRHGEVLTPDIDEGLRWYLEGPLRAQLAADPPGLPDDLTFVFGHTHKPFSERRAIAGWPSPVAVYNTGGWVVDATQPVASQGGAAILVDESLNVVSLRLYSQMPDGSPCRVSVESACGDAGANPLLDRVRHLVDPDAEPWRAFSEAVAEAIPFRNGVIATAIGRATAVVSDGVPKGLRAPGTTA